MLTSLTPGLIVGLILALPFSAGALAGMIGGRSLASRLAGPQLQKGFAAVSALVAIAMIVKAAS